MLRRKKHSIQAKMTVFFVTLAMALFLSVSLLFFHSTKVAIDASKENELSALARETANKIDRFILERYGDITVMAESPLMRDDIFDAEWKLQYMNSVIKAYQTYDFIVVTDPQGQITQFAGSSAGDEMMQTWFSRVNHANVFVSDIIYSSQLQTYGIYFSAPVWNAEKTLHSIVVGRMNFAAISDIVHNVNFDDSAAVYLVDQNGRTVFGTSPTRRDVSSDIREAKSNIFYYRHDGTRYVAAFYPLTTYGTQTTHWYLIVEEPIRQAFQVTDKLRGYTILVTLIAVAALFIFAMIISNIITRPIKHLVEETQNIVDGNMTHNVKVPSSDEIGSLAQSFNILLSDLNGMVQQVLEKSGEAASFEEIRQYVQMLFDQIPTAVVTIDNTGKVTAYNHVAVEITHIEAERILGRNLADLDLEEIRPIIRLLMDSFEKEIIYIKQIIQIRHPHQGEFPIMISTSIQKDMSGKTIGVVGVFRKAEEIRQFEESILRARNLASLGAMSAGMAHEIRNPLTSIKGYAQYIQSELGDNHELILDLQVIIHEVDRLNGIIGRFLAFAKPQQPVLQQTDVNRLVKEVLQLVEKDLPESIRLDVTLRELPLIPLDPTQIEQTLLNMILNSIQAMPEGGMLTIMTRPLETLDFVEIVIQDNGVGIDPQNYDKIFEPFFTTKAKGTGLGLAICSRIIENHSGLIEVSSTPGISTTFVIKLPVKN